MNDEGIGGTGGGGDSLARTEVSAERRERDVTVLSSSLSAKPNPGSSSEDESHLAPLDGDACLSSSKSSSQLSVSSSRCGDTNGIGNGA